MVADEVRNLASKSGEAARETAALIEGSVQNVSRTAVIVQAIDGSPATRDEFQDRSIIQ